jgi:putative ABC transport system permease protein
VESVLQDIRFGVRLLLKQRGFSLVALLTLALGIGATTALFCVIDAALIRPLPYPHPEQLVRLLLVNPEKPARGIALSLVDLDDLRTLTHVFSHVATTRSDSAIVIDGPDPERVSFERVTADYLPMYGVTPILGRAFTTDDERLDAAPVVILGYRYWQSHYHGDTNVIGRSIRFATDPATIVGVMASGPAELKMSMWRPLQATPDVRAGHQFGVWARLRDGVTPSQAEREAGPLMARASKERAGNAGLTGIVVTSEYETTTRSYRSTVNVLAGAVGFVLLIACVNVASLQLARGRTREAELAVRASLGAGRQRLVRQLLTENVVLGLGGSVIGCLVAWLTLDTLVANVPIDFGTDVALNPAVLAVTALLAIVVGIVCGLAAALKLSRTGVSAALARSSRTVKTTLSRRTGGLLLAVEMAAAVLLVAGAALMLRSFARLGAVDLGFDPNQIVTLEVTPVDPSPQAFVNYYGALLSRLRTLPFVKAAGGINNLPLSGNVGMTMAASNLQTDLQGVNIQQITPGYIEAIGLPLREGRFVTDADVATGEPWAMLNDRAAAQFFPGRSAVGGQIRAANGAWRTVLGVVGDVQVLGPMKNPPPGMPTSQVYVAYEAPSGYAVTSKATGSPLVIVVRPSTATAPAMFSALRNAARIDGMPVIVRRVRTGNEWWSASVVTDRQRTVLLALLGALGLVLALVGVFGVTSFAVSRRTSEIGVRMALGASSGQVVMAMVKESALPMALGILAGLIGASMLTKVISTFLFQTDARDPLSFAAVACVLAVSGAIAAWIPARRAARVDPAVALRAE